MARNVSLPRNIANLIRRQEHETRVQGPLDLSSDAEVVTRDPEIIPDDEDEGDRLVTACILF